MQLAAPRHQRQNTASRECTFSLVIRSLELPSFYSSEAVVRSHSSLLPTDIVLDFSVVPSLLFPHQMVCMVPFFPLSFVFPSFTERAWNFRCNIPFIAFWFLYMWFEGRCLFYIASDFVNAQGVEVHSVNFFCVSRYIYCYGVRASLPGMWLISLPLCNPTQSSNRHHDLQGYGEGSSSLFSSFFCFYILAVEQGDEAICSGSSLPPFSGICGHGSLAPCQLPLNLDCCKLALFVTLEPWIRTTNPQHPTVYLTLRRGYLLGRWLKASVSVSCSHLRSSKFYVRVSTNMVDHFDRQNRALGLFIAFCEDKPANKPPRSAFETLISNYGSCPSSPVSTTSLMAFENNASVSFVFLLLLCISIDDLCQFLDPGLLFCLPLIYALAEFVLYNNLTDRASSLSCSASIVIL